MLPEITSDGAWDDLPDEARLWIYVADRQLSEAEVAKANAALSAFAKQWTAHRRELSAYGDVVYGRFVRLAVDESAAGASGCSIDASVHFLQRLGTELGVDFFERMTFFADNGEGFLPYPRDKFAAAYARNDLKDSSPVVDTLVDTKGKYESGFVKALAESWLARMV